MSVEVRGLLMSEVTWNRLLDDVTSIALYQRLYIDW